MTVVARSANRECGAEARYRLVCTAAVDYLWDGARIKSSRQNDELAGHMQVCSIRMRCRPGGRFTGGGGTPDVTRSSSSSRHRPQDVLKGW